MKNEVLAPQKAEDRELVEQSLVLTTKYDSFVIKTNDDRIEAAGFEKDVKNRYDIIDDREKEITKPLNLAKKSIMDLFRPAKDALEKTKRRLKNLQLDWDAEQQHIADEINRKAQAVADKKAADLRAKAEAELKAGNEEKAKKLQAKAEEKEIFVPTIKADIPVIQGQHCFEKWYHKVEDITKLDRKYMIENDDMLSKIATATKGTLAIEGVRFFSKKILSSRG